MFKSKALNKELNKIEMRMHQHLTNHKATLINAKLS